MSALGSSCVLVVDDEPDIRETLREVVELVGCVAVLAADGAEGLKLLEQCRPCLTILDLRMPVMTGQEFIVAMRQKPALASLPVLVSTSSPEQAPAGLPVLPKPIDIQRLFHYLRRSCSCGSLPVPRAARGGDPDEP
jgi:CheY-like chemotaxis protein